MDNSHTAHIHDDITMIPMFYHDAQLSFQQSFQHFQHHQQQLLQQQQQQQQGHQPSSAMAQPFNLFAGGYDANLHTSMSQAMELLQYHQQHPSNNPLLLGSSSLSAYTAAIAGMIHPSSSSTMTYPPLPTSGDVYLDHSFGLGGACDLASVDLHWLNFTTETSCPLSEPLPDAAKHNKNNTTTTATTTTIINDSHSHVVTESEENSMEPDDDSVVSGILEAFDLVE